MQDQIQRDSVVASIADLGEDITVDGSPSRGLVSDADRPVLPEEGAPVQYGESIVLGVLAEGDGAPTVSIGSSIGFRSETFKVRSIQRVGPINRLVLAR